MKTVPIKKKSNNRSQDNEKTKNGSDLNGNNVQPGAESFAQDAKEIRCFCCGKEGELVSNCPLKDKIPSKEWFNKTGVEHWKTKKVNMQLTSNNEKVTSDSKPATKVGFVGMQTGNVESNLEPNILLDCGSTISLFKDKIF